MNPQSWFSILKIEIVEIDEINTFHLNNMSFFSYSVVSRRKERKGRVLTYQKDANFNRELWLQLQYFFPQKIPNNW